MRCLYCESEISKRPLSGICPNCGGNLPKVFSQEESPLRECTACGRKSHSAYCPDCGRSLTHTPPSPPPNAHTPIVPGRTCCARCYSRDITFKKRGFSWGVGILGFILLPPFGVLLGFIGAKKLRFRCHHCSHKWILY